MITEKVKDQIIEAMKKDEKVRLSTLRMLSSSLHNAKIAKMDDLTEEEEIDVVQKEAKKRKDAIEAYEKAGEVERAEREKEELKILEEYLPEQMSDEDIEKIVDDAIKELNASDMSDMGKVMGNVVGKTKGKADGKRVSEIVNKKLGK